MPPVTRLPEALMTGNPPIPCFARGERIEGPAPLSSEGYVSVAQRAVRPPEWRERQQQERTAIRYSIDAGAAWISTYRRSVRTYCGVFRDSDFGRQIARRATSIHCGMPPESVGGRQ
jgi:hypothetical protein